jgi:hypothetical protein
MHFGLERPRNSARCGARFRRRAPGIERERRRIAAIVGIHGDPDAGRHGELVPHDG